MVVGGGALAPAESRPEVRGSVRCGVDRGRWDTGAVEQRT